MIPHEDKPTQHMQTEAMERPGGRSLSLGARSRSPTTSVYSCHHTAHTRSYRWGFEISARKSEGTWTSTGRGPPH